MQEIREHIKNYKTNVVVKTFKSLFSLIFPNICSCCGGSLGESEKCICVSCLVSLPYTHFEQSVSDSLIKSIFQGRVNLEGIGAYLYFSKNNLTQKLLHEFKYKHNRMVGLVLGSHFGRVIKENNYFGNIDYIVAVPLHSSKLRKRGYNQSEIIATAIANELGIKTCYNNLVKRKSSSSQTKKRRWERWTNVKESFFCINPEVFENKHILIVDDVLTTGATLEASSRAILKGVNARISFAILAWAWE